MKTFLRRPGNKTKHLKYIIPMIPEFTGTYIEPFLGSGAVYLHLLPKKAILNDLNKDIINIWKLVKNKPEFLIEEVDKFKNKFLHLNNKEKLKMCKDIVSKMDSLKGEERTVKYLLMNYCSFNSCIYSNNKLYISGLNGNIHSKNQCHIFSQDYKIKISSLKDILKKIKLYSKDYSNIIENSVKGDFIFLDPPYLEEKEYLFNYNKDTEFDIEKLKNQLEILDKKGVKWLMTQIDIIQIRNLFKNYNMKIYNNDSNYRGIRSVKKELIITNY
jgi:DNA adenine methylase